MQIKETKYGRNSRRVSVLDMTPRQAALVSYALGIVEVQRTLSGEALEEQKADMAALKELRQAFRKTPY